MAQISNYIYGILIVSLVVSMVGFAMYGFYTNDNTLKTNEGNISLFTNFDEMDTLTQQMRNETLLAKTEAGTLDKLGAFFTNGYQTMKLTLVTMDTGVELANEGQKQLKLGEVGEVLKGFLITLLILSLIFAIIYILVKVDV